jgi:hypothetical protein
MQPIATVNTAVTAPEDIPSADPDMEELKEELDEVKTNGDIVDQALAEREAAIFKKGTDEEKEKMAYEIFDKILEAKELEDKELEKIFNPVVQDVPQDVVYQEEVPQEVPRCKHGKNCWYLAQGNCRNWHPPEDYEYDTPVVSEQPMTYPSYQPMANLFDTKFVPQPTAQRSYQPLTKSSSNSSSSAKKNSSCQPLTNSSSNPSTSAEKTPFCPRMKKTGHCHIGNCGFRHK